MKKFWNVTRWFILVGLVLVMVLMLSTPKRPSPRIGGGLQKQLAGQFEQKLEHLEAAKQEGVHGQTESFTAEEVNAGIQDMTANAETVMGTGRAEDAEVKIVGVNFIGDEAVGQFIVPRYGKDIYITMKAHLSAKDGYANLELTSAKIGNLDVPVSMINPRLQQRLAEPQQKERLKLPEFIADMRVEHGQLVFVEK
ncbi:hypothetical protein Acid345_2662 [Candidatus Koribacter versatilis Ellin345]|uniref:Uncharacterized protein n=1 Tax=Koribacter versatilis (strain Ellin345) TaxID=204669 RepID=Q1IN87_KORVE|nr:hypothetical protein [Candidatus Koribacter versatilis]ABF41663.1 hypothetical protein Acid345_2662 [Candidatus Koribacter versatilis Ellin345]